MRNRRVSRGMLAGVAFLAIAGLTVLRSDQPLSAQPGTGGQLPSLEQRLSAWSQAGQGERIPVSVSLGKRVPDAQVEQLARRYDLQPYAVFMWSDGMTGIHRTDRSKASVEVIAAARASTVGMKQKAQQSNRFRSQRFAQEHPQDKVQNDQALAQRARFLLKAAEQNERILNAARNGAPLIYGFEALGTPEQIRKLAQDPAVTGVEPAVVSEGRVAVPPVKAPEETRGSFEMPEIDRLAATDAYNRVKQSGSK